MSNTGKHNKKTSGRVLRFDRDSEFFAKRADNRRMQNDPANAAKLYWAALDRNPMDHEVRLALADVLSDMQRYGDSNHVLIPHMHEDEYFLKEAYCRVGFNFFSMGEFEAARHCFDVFFELTDEVSERTDVIMDAIDYMDSVDDRESTLADASEAQTEQQIQNAHACMSSNRFGEARDILQQLYEAQPEDRRIRYDLALACMCGKDYRMGVSHIDALLEKDPGDISALSLKLIFAHNVHDEVMVSSVCNQLAKCDPVLPDELVPIIGVILDVGRTELALTLAKRAYKKAPFDRLSNHVLALCYIKTKQFQIASKIYDRLLCICPTDSIARIFRSKCVENTKAFDSVSMDSIAHYQVPIAEMMENVKLFTSIDLDDKEALIEKWRTDPQFVNSIRWGFTLRDFSICYGMLSMLRVIGDNDAELLMREAIIDPDTNPTLAHEALGMLKSIEAKEPYFAFINGSLLEGRVNMVDLTHSGVPKQYRLIYPRFNSSASGLYDFEVYAAASAILESFFASAGPEFPPLDEKRSTALSAALEFAACRKCGVAVKEDILDRYGVTERRLLNAFERLLAAVMKTQSDEEVF